jgi:signal transduction histidine kinase
MPRDVASRLGPRRLAGLLVVSFGLTVLSFLITTAVTLVMSQGIAAASSSISSNSVPSIAHLLGELTEQRRLAVLLREYSEQRLAGQDAEALVPQIEESRRMISQEWRAYRSLPSYAGEEELSADISRDLQWLDVSITRFLQEARTGTAEGARRILDEETRPVFSRLDVGLHAITELNRQNAARLAAQVLSTYHASRLWALILTSLSALFAGITAFTVGGIIRRYAVSAETRVSELQFFAGRVAHDIRSPLASVGLALDVSRKNEQIDPRTRTLLDRGTRTLQRVGQLVDGLLVFARAGAPPREGARTNTTDVIEDVLHSLQPIAQESEIELVFEPSETLLAACHPGVFASIVSNLVANALKYMGDATMRRVSVRTTAADGMVRLEVEDSGPGIPLELQRRIFDPYVRAAGATVPGLGLGLATVRRLAEAHGGTATVMSRVGEGSVFRVELPRAVETSGLDESRRLRSQTKTSTPVAT